MSVLHKIGKFIMSLLPNKNLFIVTSALHANIGVVNMQDRVIQTIDTLDIKNVFILNAAVNLHD